MPDEKKELTPEQIARRRVVEEHTRILGKGVRRGPNAPADGSFGGVKKGSSKGGD